MRRSLSVRIAALVLVASMAIPAFAAPQRDESPIDGLERAITRVVKQIRNIIQPLTDMLTVPK